MTLEEYIKKGQIALEQEDLKTAREAFEAAIEEEGTNAAAWHGLGHVLIGENQLDQAVECYEYAFSQDENLLPPWTTLGQIATQNDEGQQAAKFFKNAIQLDPQNSEPWNGLGILYASKLGKAEEAGRCFLRAEHLGRDRHANNLFTIFSQLPPQPFFSYRTIRDYMPTALFPQWKEYHKAVLEETLPLWTFLHWQNQQIDDGQAAPPKWEMWQGIIQFLTGDPAVALAHLNKAQAETAETDLMIAYYQIQCAWDFVEQEAGYMEAALAKAEQYVPKIKSSGWGPFAKKKAVAPPLSPDELLPCYYAGLIFIEHEDLKKAMMCLERIEQDFAPAAYLALWLTEEMVLPKKKKQKADVLLEWENRERQFTEGMNTFQLDTDIGSFLKQLAYVNHYLELADAIDILHYFAEFEGNPYDLEIHMAKDQRPFYMLWELTDEQQKKFTGDFLSHFYQQLESTMREQLPAIQAGATAGSVESPLATAIASGALTIETAPLLTAYFQHKGQLETKSRHLLDLFVQIPFEEKDASEEMMESEAAENIEEEAQAIELPDKKLLFLIDSLLQIEEQQTAGKLAEHFQAFREEWETPPTTFADFREQFETFIESRPEPEPEEAVVEYEVIEEEE